MRATSETRVLYLGRHPYAYAAVKQQLAIAAGGPFHVIWADDGNRVEQCITEHQPDVALIEQEGGEPAGCGLFCGPDGGAPAIPVVMLMEAAHPADAVRARELGVEDCLLRQHLTPELLARSLQYAIERFEMRAKLRQAKEELEARVRDRTAELERANAELERFAHIVAHELQMPLKTIRKHLAKLTEEEEAKPGENGDSLHFFFLCKAAESAERMSALIRQVLEYARVGGQRGCLRHIDLNTVVKRVLGDLAAAVEGSGARIEVEALPEVLGEPTLLGQLFENLLGNALKFSGDAAPRVRLWSERCEDDRWLLAVRDEGVGIGDGDAAKIFDIFHRGRACSNVPGDGIGLALCKRIVECHGGRIWVASRPGEGATFLFTLPAAPVREPRYPSGYSYERNPANQA